MPAALMLLDRSLLRVCQALILCLIPAGFASAFHLTYGGNPGHRQMAGRALDLAVRKGFSEKRVPLEDVRARIETGAYMEDYAAVPGTVSQFHPDPWDKLPLLDFGGFLPLEPIPVGSLVDTLSGWARGLPHGYDPAHGFRWPGTRWTTPGWGSATTNAFTWQQAVALHRSGKVAEAYECLGHLLHLLADLSVPSHVAVVNHGVSLTAKRSGQVFDPDLGIVILDEYESALNGGLSLGGIPLVIPDLLGVFLGALDSARADSVPVYARWEEYLTGLALETLSAAETSQFFSSPASEGEFGKYRNVQGVAVEASQFAVTPPLSIGGRWTQLSLRTTARLALPPNDSGPILPEQAMASLARKLVPRAVEYGAGLILAFEAAVKPAVTVHDDAVPGSPGMISNFPNPFNPATVISFRMPDGQTGECDVRLMVVDLLGREVVTLVNERRASGRYEVVFDGTGLAGGVYVCRLTAGGFFAVRKMLLAK